MSESAGPQRWFFDAWSFVYDRPLFQRLTYRPVHDALLEALSEPGRRRVLDVGCGTGLLSARIQRELPSTRVVGCDFSRGMLRRARAHGHEVAWVQGNALQLPFRSASFDAVVSTEAFHWFPDQAAALAEFFRVLAPEAALLLTVMSPPFAGMSRVLHQGSRWLGQPLYWPTRRELRAQLEVAGFRVEAQKRLFRIPGGLMLPPFLSVAIRPGASAVAT